MNPGAQDPMMGGIKEGGTVSTTPPSTGRMTTELTLGFHWFYLGLFLIRRPSKFFLKSYSSLPLWGLCGFVCIHTTKHLHATKFGSAGIRKWG